MTNKTPTIKEIESTLSGFALYKTLKDVGYPQGGQGNYIIDSKTEEKAYIPTPPEIYNSFIEDPKGWGELVDILSREWIKRKK